MSLTPKHWDDFQHYKDRAPSWIKLHRKLLDDFAFHRLPVASKALAPMLWLLASEYEHGKITATMEEIAFRLRTTEKDVIDAVKPLIELEFFIADSTLLADRYQVAIPEKRRGEERREQERGEIETQDREETDIRAVATAPPPNAGKIFDEQFWFSYPRRDGANPKAPARKAFITAVKNGHSPPAMVTGAQRYAASLSKSNQVGTKYVAQAVTWLHQCRWEDYPETEAPTGRPQPPDPAMPSDEELRKRYGASNAKDRGAEGENRGAQQKRTGVCGEDGPPGAPKPTDYQTQNSGVGSVGELLREPSGILPLGDELRGVEPRCGPDGEGDDGANPVAGMVRH
jgi:hypothetical protein